MNLFKLLGNLSNLARVQEEMQAISEELAQMQYEGRAGGDMVVVKVNGLQQLQACHIDPQLVSDNDRELIEELVVTAANAALARSKSQGADLMQQKLSERLNLPDLSTLLTGMMSKT